MDVIEVPANTADLRPDTSSYGVQAPPRQFQGHQVHGQLDTPQGPLNYTILNGKVTPIAVTEADVAKLIAWQDEQPQPKSPRQIELDHVVWMSEKAAVQAEVGDPFYGDRKWASQAITTPLDDLSVRTDLTSNEVLSRMQHAARSLGLELIWIPALSDEIVVLNGHAQGKFAYAIVEPAHGYTQAGPTPDLSQLATWLQVRLREKAIQRAAIEAAEKYQRDKAAELERAKRDARPVRGSEVDHLRQQNAELLARLDRAGL